MIVDMDPAVKPRDDGVGFLCAADGVAFLHDREGVTFLRESLQQVNLYLQIITSPLMV